MTIRAHGLLPAAAQRAIDDAFTAVAHIHSCMSFHERESDVSRLNREAHESPVAVDSAAFDVLDIALRFAEESKGVFDITVAPQLVDLELLPSPAGASRPDPAATWHDVELLPERRVRFHRPLWLDLGGIAKGYAVDRAIERLIAHGATQTSVNAGGDLRVYGARTEHVLLAPDTYGDGVPVIEIENGSIASSEPRAHTGSHRAGSFVSVIAEDCVVADALTKVVFARGRAAAPLLVRHGAAAHLYNSRTGWQHFGAHLSGPHAPALLAS